MNSVERDGVCNPVHPVNPVCVSRPLSVSSYKDAETTRIRNRARITIKSNLSQHTYLTTGKSSDCEALSDLQ